MGLLYSANAELAEVGDRFGPRVAAEARRIRAEIARSLAAGPAAEAIDSVLTAAQGHRARGRLVLAVAHYREAAEMARHRPDRHRLGEASRAAEELASASGGRDGT